MRGIPDKITGSRHSPSVIIDVNLSTTFHTMIPVNRIARITRIPLRARHYGPSDEEMHSNTGPPTSEPEPFYPNILDVLRVRHLLRWKVIPHGLPTEIVDLIIDAAEYWPSTVTSMEKETVIRQDRDQELVRTLPLCFDEKVSRYPLLVFVR